MNRMGKPHRGNVWHAFFATFAVAAFTSLALTGSALALKPSGEYVNFSDCPDSNPAVVSCLFAQTTSGEFKIAGTTVPITNTITLQGGLEEKGAVDAIVPANDGNTLSKTPQTVPGGLLKILAPEFLPEPLKKFFNEFINKGITGVTATTELAGTATINPLAELIESGTALSLPVRVHLENSFLGNECYIGSKASPVNVELTDGTTSPPPPNTAIKGKLGELGTRAGGEILVIKGNTLVNNSFSAPVAEGCGSQILFGLFTGLIDSAVDSELGLPSAAGNNTAILSGSQEIAAASAVLASEK